MVTVGVLRTVPLFAGLPEEQLAALARGSTVRKIPRGAFVLRAREKSDGLYFVLSGRAKVLIPDEEGREVILAAVGAGEFFGEMGTLDDLPRSASVRTLEASEIMCVGKAEFLSCLLANRDLSMRVMRSLVGRLREADRHIESLALLDVYGRVSRILLELAEDVDGRLVVLNPPRKQEIANRIGASREMVSRVLRNLEKSGQLSMDRRQIVLLDKSRPATGAPREPACLVRG